MKLVIIDWKWTLFNPPSAKLIDGAYEVLDFLHSRNVKISLVGKDQGGDMNSLVNNLGVAQFFSAVEFVSGPKTSDLLKKHMAGVAPTDVWVVGDRVKVEIAIGNALGAQTVWLKAGKFANETPTSKTETPRYTVGSLIELKNLLKRELDYKPKKTY